MFSCKKYDATCKCHTDYKQNFAAGEKIQLMCLYFCLIIISWYGGEERDRKGSSYLVHVCGNVLVLNDDEELI